MNSKKGRPVQSGGTDYGKTKGTKNTVKSMREGIFAIKRYLHEKINLFNGNIFINIMFRMGGAFFNV